MSKTKIGAALRREILVRDGRKCCWCGKGSADGVTLHIDHILAEAWGGETIFENLAVLCAECNLGKSAEYCGSYLLTTLVKTNGLDQHIKEEEKDGVIRASLVFFIDRPDLEYFLPRKIYQVASIPKSFPPLEGDTRAIRMSQARRQARAGVKAQIRDFVFNNQGFIEELDERLIFVPRPRPAEDTQA